MILALIAGISGCSQREKKQSEAQEAASLADRTIEVVATTTMITDLINHNP